MQPFLALAGGLAAAGHTVRLVMTTQADKAYEAPPGVRLERAGAPVTGDAGAALFERVMRLGSPLAQARTVLEEGFEPHAAAMAEAAADLAGSTDVVVRHHFLYMARDHASRAGIPDVSVYLTPDLIPTRAHPPTGMPSFGPFQGLAWWIANRGIGSVFLEPARRHRASLGLPSPKGMLTDVWPSDHASLVGVSPGLCPRPADWPAHVVMTGFLRGPAATGGALDPALEAFLARGEPPVYARSRERATVFAPGTCHRERATCHRERATVFAQPPESTGKRTAR